MVDARRRWWRRLRFEEFCRTGLRWAMLNAPLAYIALVALDAARALSIRQVATTNVGGFLGFFIGGALFQWFYARKPGSPRRPWRRARR